MAMHEFVTRVFCLGLFLTSLATVQGFCTLVPGSFLAHCLPNAAEQAATAATGTSTQLWANPSEILMPALSSTMKEGKVVSWLKSEGEAVQAGEAIMVVESDKADMDVEAFEDGFLAKILVGEGESTAVGAPVALVVASQEEIAEVAEGSTSTGAGSAQDAAAATATTTATSTGESLVETTPIYMPALSSTMSEGKVVEWFKGVGDMVTAGEILMVVESDKADMDVEAFDDGYLAAILKQPGEPADVGAPLALMVPDKPSLETFLAHPVLPSSSSSSASLPTTSSSASATGPASPPDLPFSQIDLPALSSTMKEGRVVSWLKAEGDPIAAGEAIMVVESDKADMDVESFEDGFLAAILIQEGETGAVGAPAALIASNADDIPALQQYAAALSDAPAPAATPAAATPAAPASPATPAIPRKITTRAAAAAQGNRVVASPLAKKKADQLGIDINTIAGTGPGGRVTATDVEAAANGTGAPKKEEAAAPKPPPKPVWIPAEGVVAATPMARAAAKKAKLDIAAIKGTGEFGRVTLHDVQLVTGESDPDSEAATSSLPDGFVPFKGMQKAVSNNMMATLASPSFQVSTDIEMDNFEALYAKVKSDGISVSALLAKAVALAVEKHPIMNSAYSDQSGGGILYRKDINIAMAVAIEGGLITPTLVHANTRPVKELALNWRELVGKARTGTLAPAEYSSGTFTISNMGMFGVSHFGSLLPAGQGTIMAVGATQDVIAADSMAVLGMKKVRKMTVTITCDHRQIYGTDAALFLKTFKKIMEEEVDKLGK
eukprot:Nitzschia sp. Nitz4//scaffold152_size53828//10947//13289//NITZ4_006736-RA/size53828-processed-gene-0.79-mRNA-1//-1//CDS//3329537184//6577//frame0